MRVLHTIRRAFLNIVQDTPLEGIARNIHGLLFQRKGARYDAETRKIFHRILGPNSNCIDVGAYRGEILAEMLKVAPNGTILAFEPIPENAMYVARRFPGVKVHNIALSDRKGNAHFFHVVGRPARSGLSRQNYPDPNETVEKIDVRTDRLDNLVPADLRVDLIKIDVEGAELQVLRGARELILRNRPIIVLEHGPEMATKFDTSSEDLYRFLNFTCELSVSTLGSFLNDEPPLDLGAFLDETNSDGEFYFVASPIPSSS